MWHLTLVALASLVSCVRIIEPGPKYPPTKGEVWPKPKHQYWERTFFVIASPIAFTVSKPNHTCDILDKAVTRLLHDTLRTKFSIVRPRDNGTEPAHRNNMLFAGIITQNTEFRIDLTKACEKYPHLDMDESYSLDVDQNVVLTSASIWGILRGLETFNHLLYFADDFTEIRINATSIADYPSYKYRGLLIDTGRHYLRISTIHSLLDAMEMNKMNVLHWHIVDDQSFPYQSEKFRSLSKKGAFHPSMVYTKDDIQRVIEHGRLAGIRVIPEFDIPGHVRSWGEAYPEILTQCYQDGKVVGLGPLDPLKNATYTFLQQLYQEVKEWFPDEYIHVGGDEVDLSCWRSNPKVQRYMEKHQITEGKLHALFMRRVQSMLPSPFSSHVMVWQEVFDNGVLLPKQSIVQVWMYKWTYEMVKILRAGHRVVFSSSWYLDYLDQGWETFYEADPRRMVYSYSNEEKYLKDIIGGEACMWGEMADDNNVVSRTWPRASAVAERLWDGTDHKSWSPRARVTEFVRRRMEEHVCRMLKRGVRVEPPNGPGFCLSSAYKPDQHKQNG